MPLEGQGGKREAINLEEQSAIRMPDLIPLRYKRMSASPFTFTGAPCSSRPMTGFPPVTGDPGAVRGRRAYRQFRHFRSPSARLVFDINDFDKPLSARGNGIWKRLAASVRSADAPTKSRRRTVAPPSVQCVPRTRMKWFSEMVTLTRGMSTWTWRRRSRPLRDHRFQAAVCCVRRLHEGAAEGWHDAAAAKPCAVMRAASSGSNPIRPTGADQLDDYADLDALRHV